MLVVAAGLGVAWRQERLRASLLSHYADSLPNDPALHVYARRLAVGAYAQNCASCHGENLQGNKQRGVPDLRRGVWLYDFGRVSDIERTILYGIRSGHGKARNTTDMPGFGVSHRLSDDEIRDVASYVLSLSRKGSDSRAVARGAAIYQGKGECFDCHGADASGNIDWGVPALIGGTLLYGATRADVTASIHDGRHGRCPAWIGVLDPAAIRALAVMLHDTARGKPQA
jgi:cytochrome c oxidase cbb3-type subunit 3